ncbi:hypothetical protein B0H14DRAFT_2640190 [Mycena olivaceomarginata]|nr:hypothetical protein B0H14DRAFT_2640190 [Mycena olivaceomarginata]
MSGHFHDFGKELGVTDPKSLKDIYKTHLENCICTELNALANVDSVLQCMALGLGLLYLGLQDAWDTTIETFKAIEHPISKIVQIVVEHLQRPQLPILNLNTLSKYSHNDNNLAVALSAIFVMELLARCYSKEPNCLFMVHIAQELVHIGKDTPFFSNGSIMSRPANAGFLPTLMASTDAKHCKCPQFITSSSTNTTGMYLRFLITVNGELNNSTIAVHIGQILAGAQCSGTGWKAVNNLRVPDALDAHVAGIDQAGRNCDRQSYPASFYLAGTMSEWDSAVAHCAQQRGGRCICAPKYWGQRVGTWLVRETWTKDSNGEFHGIESRGPTDQPSTTKLWARFQKSKSLNSELRAPSTQRNAAVGRASPTIMLDSGQALPLTGWDSTSSSVPDLSLYMNNFRQYIIPHIIYELFTSPSTLYLCAFTLVPQKSNHKTKTPASEAEKFAEAAPIQYCPHLSWRFNLDFLLTHFLLYCLVPVFHLSLEPIDPKAVVATNALKRNQTPVRIHMGGEGTKFEIKKEKKQRWGGNVGTVSSKKDSDRGKCIKGESNPRRVEHGT